VFREYFDIRQGRGDITYLVTIIIMIVLPLHYKFLPPLMILLCLGWIFENYLGIGKIVRSPSRYLLFAIAFLVFYLWQIATLLYSSDLKTGWSNVFGRLSLIIFSLIFFMPGEKIRTNGIQLLRIFSICTAVYVITCFGYALFRSIAVKNGIWSFNPHPAEYEWINYFFGTDFAYSIHPSYLSMYVLLSVFISFESWYDISLKKGFRIGWLILGVFMLSSIYFISSRAAIIAAIMMISLYALNKIIILKKSRLIWISLIAILIFSLPLIRNNDRLNYVIQGFSNEENFDIRKQDERILVWESAIEIIKKNPVLGVGIGDVRNELVKEYVRMGEDKLSQERLNAHNQFLEVLLEGGVISFLMFLFILGFMIFIAINEKNLLYGLFIIMMLVFFMFETALYRFAGNSFFSLFSFLLLYAPGGKYSVNQK
jgi:O-antigen ligase